MGKNRSVGRKFVEVRYSANSDAGNAMKLPQEYDCHYRQVTELSGLTIAMCLLT